jgi:uncharacterized protein
MLLVPEYFKIDIIQEIERICPFNYKLMIIDKVINELNTIIEKQKPKAKTAAKIALLIIKNNNIQTIKTEKKFSPVDDLIIKYAKENDCIIATQDLELKKRAKKKKLPIIILRQKKYLKLENP